MNLFSSAILLLALSSATHASGVVFEQEIRVAAPPEVVWDALTKPDLVRTYHFAPLRKIELKKGGEIVYGTAEKVMISGIITEIEPNVKLSHTFRFGAKQNAPAGPDAETLVTYSISKDGAATVLKLTHSGFPEKNQNYANVTGGWPFILKKMKSALDGVSAK